MSTIQHPNEIVWIEGELPDITTVSYDCMALTWIVCDELTLRGLNRKDLLGKLAKISTVYPFKNDLNPLRWECSGLPLAAYGRVTHWAWINKGEDKKEDAPIDT